MQKMSQGISLGMSGILCLYMVSTCTNLRISLKLDFISPTPPQILIFSFLVRFLLLSTPNSFTLGHFKINNKIIPILWT